MQALHVRDGRVMGTQGFGFSGVSLDDGDVMSSFLGQYYGAEEGREIPAEVLTPLPVEDDGALGGAVRRARRARASRCARRSAGRLRRAARDRARQRRARPRQAPRGARERRGGAAPSCSRRSGCAASRVTSRATTSRRFAGTLSVASRVVFRDGQPSKADYRRYRIREAAPDDDFACLREVLARRLARVESEPLPDLMLVDGGKGQLAVLCTRARRRGPRVRRDLDREGARRAEPVAARAALGRAQGGADLPARRKDPVSLPPSSRALLLLQRVRDESHRFAIEFQRELRSKAGLVSILEELPGIGPGKRRALLRELGSLRAVRSASLERLAAVPGISARDAATLQRFFAALSPARRSPRPSAEGAPQ